MSEREIDDGLLTRSDPSPLGRNNVLKLVILRMYGVDDAHDVVVTPARFSFGGVQDFVACT